MHAHVVAVGIFKQLRRRTRRRLIRWCGCLAPHSSGTASSPAQQLCSSRCCPQHSSPGERLSSTVSRIEHQSLYRTHSTSQVSPTRSLPGVQTHAARTPEQAQGNAPTDERETTNQGRAEASDMASPSRRLPTHLGLVSSPPTRAVTKLSPNSKKPPVYTGGFKNKI